MPRDGGFAHVSCLAEQAKILVAEAEENNLAVCGKVKKERWGIGGTRVACAEQMYHGVVRSARSGGRAGRRTRARGPETDGCRKGMAMNQLGNGLTGAGRHAHEDGVVRERGRVGCEAAHWRISVRGRAFRSSCRAILRTPSYHEGRHEEALRLRTGCILRIRLKLLGE